MPENSDFDRNGLTIYECIKSKAEEYKDLTAIEYYGNKISYTSLLANVDRCAAAMYLHGVRSGMHVAVILPNVPQAVFVFYACSKLGAVCDLIHPLSAVRELESYIASTNPQIVFVYDELPAGITFLSGNVKKVVLVSPAEYLPRMARLALKVRSGVKTPAFIRFETFPEFFKKGTKPCSIKEDDRPIASDACAMLYTGGTTGKAKGVLLSSTNFNKNAEAAIESCECLEKGDRFLSVLPIFHGFGLGVGIHTVLMYGGTSILLPIFKVKKFIQLISKYKPAVIAGVPAIFGAIVAGDSKDVDMSFVKLVISGGDRLPSDTQDAMNELLSRHGSKAVVRQGYGLTECLSGVSLMPPGCLEHNCIGRPYGNTNFKIIDPETGNELPKGTNGEILISGPSVMIGYFNEKEENRDTLKMDEKGRVWLHTGDMGRIGENGLLYFECRIKRMIITNGYNVYPGVLEDVIRSCHGVSDCAVIGVPDALRGEIVRAYIVFDKKAVREGGFDEALKEVKKELALQVSKFAMPRSFVVIDEIPKTKVGKADTEALLSMENGS
ncbi:MAG: acyl--CoA ligase [Clostridiales bacterium]|nr:acyl--CoA ligase [Clostridiales bacterium]